MRKAVMISIQPKWCKLIANGKKTIEVRKTKPKLETPFKVYIYCTNNKDMLWILKESERESRRKITSIFTAKDVGGATKANGKVIGEFVCDKITYLGNISTDPWCSLLGNVHESHKRLVTNDACLTEEELLKYGGKYGWHISDLVIYDKPRELGEFKTLCADFYDGKHCDECEYFIDGRGYEYDESDCGCDGLKPLKRPPQSWCYVEGGENDG